MATPIGSITRAATRPPQDRLRVLTFPTHERYQSGLAAANAVFYMVQAPGIKSWNATYAPLPDNHVLLDPALKDKQIPVEADFDLVLSQNKFGQFQSAKQLARMLHLPLVSIEHTLPHPSWGADQRAALKEMRGDVNVFISEYSRRAWGWDESEADVIHHGVDTNVFKPTASAKKTHVLSVVNDFVNRDWCCGFAIWKEATAGLPVCPVGDTPGLSKPAAGLADLARYYGEAAVFVNTSTVSPVPTALLEAMACGCPVVSLKNCMIPEIIEHGRNGFLAETAAELKKHLEFCLKDRVATALMGANARATIVERFSLGKFVSNWEALLRRAANITFTGN